MRQAQAIVERYEGTFLQITIGDKGSYAYINFGALSAHEDDARRAVKDGIGSEEMRRPGFLTIANGHYAGHHCAWARMAAKHARPLARWAMKSILRRA